MMFINRYFNLYFFYCALVGTSLICIAFQHNSFFSLIFSLLILLFGFFVTYSRSIVSSVLALIGLASVFSLILFGFGATFLAVLYLAVYIGAVAVFFLFVVMMTDLSDEEAVSLQKKQQPNPGFLVLGFLLTCYVFYLILSSLGVGFVWFERLVTWQDILNGGSVNMMLLNFDSNIEAIARLLFQEQVAAFIILSIVILIALVGAILLTSSMNSVDKHELAFLDLDPLSAVWENDKLAAFGDGKPQDMGVQLARTTSASVNLNQAKYF